MLGTSAAEATPREAGSPPSFANDAQTASSPFCALVSPPRMVPVKLPRFPFQLRKVSALVVIMRLGATREKNRINCEDSCDLCEDRSAVGAGPRCLMSSPQPERE